MNKKKRTKISKFPVRKINRQISKKLVGLFLVVILALVGLTVRITYINASSGNEYKRIVLQNTQQQYINRTIPFKRGDILDRNGTVLATSERVYNLILDCRVVNYEEKDDNGKTVQPYIEPTVAALVKFFKCSENDIYKRLTDETTKNSQYQVIKRNVTMAEKEAFEEYLNYDSEKVSKSDQQERDNINGVWFEETFQRVYPQDSIACDVIGYYNSTNDTAWGIEGYYSSILNGVNGRSFGYFNSDSDVEQNIIQPQNGDNVISTIDVNIQQIIRKAIVSFQEQYSSGPNGTKGAKNIAVVVMDPNNGEILGMDSSDWYDLNNPRDLSEIYGKAEWSNMSDEEQIEKMNEVWRNFCVSDAYEPGSTFKPVTVAAALATDSVSRDDHFVCDGYQMVNGLMIRCSVYPDAHGELDTAGGLEYSCNDALMQISEKLGVESFLKYQGMFNFGVRTGIDLPGEATGIIHDADTMGTLELATASFGQGFTCTMIQEASAISALVNGGYYYKPHVVKSITDSTGNLLETKNSVVERQVVSEDLSNYIRQTLGEAADHGTGQEAKVPGYSMGGKTGTAQKIPRDSGNYLVSFIGFAPLDDPQVLVYVVVDEPNAEKQDSSSFAQSIAKDIFSELLPYMNIFVDDPEEKAAYEEAMRVAEAQRQAEEQAELERQAAEEEYRQYLATLEAEEAAQKQAEADAAAAAAQAEAEAAAAAQEQNNPGVEHGISDTTIPEPLPDNADTGPPEENGIYSDGVENSTF